MKNAKFRSALGTYIRNLTRENIAFLIWNGEVPFLNTMFVMTEEDKKDDASNRHEYVCIVIPDDLLQQYIQRLLYILTMTIRIERAVDINRPLMNVMFRRAVRTYMKQLSTDTIASIINEANTTFLNTMFFMSEEDIQYDVAHRHECFGIVIPDELMQRYIARWFEYLTEPNELDEFSTVGDSTENSWVENFLENCRPLNNVGFCTALRTYMKQLKTEKISYLIQTARYDFINTMFVITEDDVNDNSEYQYERFGIIMPDVLLQKYIARWFSCLHKTPELEEIEDKNRVIKNVTFRVEFLSYMRKINTETIAAIIHTGTYDFINRMFVMTEDDIKENTRNRNDCYGIVIPNELLQQYIQRWFDDLIKTDSVLDIIDTNRLLPNVQFRSVLRTYMKQLVTKQIRSLISTAGDSFFDTMFVMTEDDIKENTANLYECFGIIIPKDFLPQYIKRLFDVLTNAFWIEDAIKESRPLKNVMFRKAVRTYMKQLPTDKISSIIKDANDSFLNTMLFLSEEDIKDDVAHWHECFGIIIPDELMQQYIARWFERLTEKTGFENELIIKLGFLSETRLVENFFEIWKPLNNVRFRTAVQTYMKQLSTDKIFYLIQSARYDFINSMFVMTEDDINPNSEDLYETVGVVMPYYLVQKYIARWFEGLIKTSCLEEIQHRNRVIKSVSFRSALLTYMREINIQEKVALIQTAKYDFINRMFVMTEDDIKENATNRNECYGIVIPGELLQQYIERWFGDLTKTDRIKDTIDNNRPLHNVQFRSIIRTYMKQLTKDQIESLINTAEDSFLNIMFVMTKEDIEEDAANLYECFGIIIPEELLQKYILRWFKYLTETNEDFMETCRPLNNVQFQAALHTFMRQLNAEKIGYLIQNAGNDFINTMFVMTEDDFNANSEKKYERFGIVIPDDLLQQYIKMWFKRLHETSQCKKFIDKNRLLKNERFCTALSCYMSKLNTERIVDLILNAKNYFINTMFVMTKKDIQHVQDNAKNRIECLNIVIPDDLLQQYIANWFARLTKINQLETFIKDNRPLRNFTFRTSLCCHMRQLTIENIGSLISNAGAEFLNKMFVITEEGIKDNPDNQYECFGIIIPDELLHQYTKRWFYYLSNTRCVTKFMDSCRPLKNLTFCSTLCYYIRQLNTETISSLVQTANNDFINTMFVMTEADLDFTSKDRYEYFGIVISDNLQQQYIERWFECLKTTMDLEQFINKNRPMKTVIFYAALRTHMKQLNIEKMWSLIQTANSEFINKMFVMTEDDIKDNFEIIYERVKNTENDLKDNPDKRYEYLGCVIPDCLLQKYFERWLNCVAQSNSAIEYMNYTRPLNNAIFRNKLRPYLRQQSTEKIWTLIGKNGRDFLNTLFVMNEEDINDNADNQYECFGIVIPGDLLNTYIERWLDRTIYKYETDKFSIKQAMAVNRPMRNVAFRKALCTYIRRLSANKIIRRGRIDFLNTMFVMSEGDIKDDATNRHECIGIIIPDDLLDQYIKRWFDGLVQIGCVEEYMNVNRPLNNVRCRKQLLTYIRQLDVRKIGTLVQTGSRDFVNTMFVMSEDDIKDNAENRYACFGIIIPDDLLHQYIEILFDGLKRANSVKESIDANRCFVNSTFRLSFQTYIKQLTLGKIENIIQTGSTDFVNTMFVITDNDIKEDSENLQECFGIILPDNLLYPYIERWFGGMTKTNSAKQYIDGNRTFMNSKFQASLNLFISGINSDGIKCLNREGHIDYLYTRQDLITEH